MYTKDADKGIWVKDKETVLVFIFIVRAKTLSWLTWILSCNYLG